MQSRHFQLQLEGLTRQTEALREEIETARLAQAEAEEHAWLLQTRLSGEVDLVMTP